MADQTPSLDPNNFVNVGPHGTFQASGELHSSPDDIVALFARLRAANTDHIVLHFHGGLVSEHSGIVGAARLIDFYKTTGAHPICFIWETGLVETVSRNLLDIHQTKLFKRLIALLAKKLAKYLGVDIGGKGPGREPGDAEIAAELDRARPFDDLDTQPATGSKGGALPPPEQLEQQLQMELEMSLSSSPELVAMLTQRNQGGELLRDDLASPGRTPGAKGPISLALFAKALARIVARSIGRWRKGRDHGFYPTLMEEVVRELYLDDLGAWVWGGMKQAAAQMWLPNNGPLDADSHPGSLFLEQLAALQRERPLTVDLVGHSAGSIAICELLRANAERGIGVNIRNIALLAPAVRSDLFHAQIVSHPERFERLRIYTMSDDYECQDSLLPYVYTRSLLYLISGILEPDQVDCPLAGMERYLGGDAPYDSEPLTAISDWLGEQDSHRLALAVTSDQAPVGMCTESRKHGDFDEDPATLDSLRRLIDA